MFVSLRTWWTACLMAACFALCGCEEERVPFLEIKRVDEPVSEQEYARWKKVVESLPGKKFPVIGPLSPVLPVWIRGRTLSISELTQMEIKANVDRWDADKLAEKLPQTKKLKRALASVSLTPAQFVSITLVLGAAVQAEKVDERLNLKKMLSDGQQVINDLKRDNKRLYSSLSDDEAFEVQHVAGWIVVVDCVERLQQVPQRNRELVWLHADELKQFLPEDLQQNPLEALKETLNASELPFVELPGADSDARITWHKAEAFFGKDPLPEKKSETHPGSSGSHVPSFTGNLPKVSLPPPPQTVPITETKEHDAAEDPAHKPDHAEHPADHGEHKADHKPEHADAHAKPAETKHTEPEHKDEHKTEEKHEEKHDDHGGHEKPAEPAHPAH